MDAIAKLRDLAVSDSGFVFDPYSGSTFSFNRTALEILRAIQAGAGKEQVVARLKELFAVEGEDLDRDIEEMVHLLRRHALVPHDFEL